MRSRDVSDFGFPEEDRGMSLADINDRWTGGSGEGKLQVILSETTWNKEGVVGE